MKNETFIKIKGIPQATNYIKIKQKDIKEGIITGIKNATLLVDGQVKLSIAGRKAEPTSVDTGRFLNSVDYSYNDSEGKVFSNLEYSKFLEYGTIKLAPRRHFRNSLYRNQSKINMILQENINKKV